MTQERLFAINACKDLEKYLSKYDFKVYKKGLCYKRKLNKDITQQILFEISRYFDIEVNISVYSKTMKKWNMEYFNENCDLVCAQHLGYMTPLKDWKTWSIYKSDIAKNQFHKEVLYQIDNYVIPFFDRFEDMNSIIDDLVNSGGHWSEYNDNLLIPPISVVLAFGTLEQAQTLLNNYSKKYPHMIKQVKKYKLDQMNHFDFNYQEFLGAVEFKIAFANGLKIV